MTRRAALALLEGVLVLVGLYAAALVLIGRHVGQLFDALGFGPGKAGVPAGEPSDHVLLMQGVLGAVIIGWVVLLLAVVRVGLRGGDPRWWWAVVTCLGTWFVIDTGFSLAVGSWQHAAFNLSFAIALAVPLARLRPGADLTR